MSRCECRGECGRVVCKKRLGYRCNALHGHINLVTGANVVLTVAHLNHTPEDNRDENLRAMCQGCHLHYDRAHHAETRRRRHNLDLFESVTDVEA